MKSGRFWSAPALPSPSMKQQNKSANAVEREKYRAQFAKALQRGKGAEDTKRTQHFKKGAKTNVVRARRRHDKAIVAGAQDADS